MKRQLLFLLLFALLVGACAPATTPAPTPVPPQPSSTPVPPTDTPIPPTATNTALPTDTPTITPTPGPVVINDDFSAENTDNWPKCDRCKWENGQLIYGPFDPGSNAGESFNYAFCGACGERNYYRMAVDVTFVDGQVDRFFGAVVGKEADRIFYLGLSPWQYYSIRDYNYTKGLLKELAFKQSGAVRASTHTNHIEITIKPAATQGMMEISFSLNGKVIYTLSSVPVFATAPGVGMSFHSTTVAYDNFEYEEIEAP